MSLTVITRPETTLPNTFVSKYSFAGNPIYYDVQRKDKTIAGVGASSGNVAFNVGTGAAIFSINDSVYVRATDGAATVFEGTFTVTNATVIAGFNWIAINKPTFTGYLDIDGGFVNNLERKNHNVITALNINGVLSEERTFTSDITGLCRVYVNSLINDYLSNLIDLVYTSNNRLVPGYVVAFKLSYKEAWVGYVDSAFKTEIATYYAVKSIQQINNDNRMVQYEVYYAGATIYSTAKFLTGFAKPKLWNGYPFTIGALLTSTTATISKNILSQPANTTETVALDLAAGPGVHELKVAPVANSQYFDIWLNTSETIDPSLNDWSQGWVTSYIVYTP